MEVSESVRPRPLDGIDTGLEELLRRILATDVLLLESNFKQLPDNQVMARDEIFLREPRMENERFVLQKKYKHVISQTRRRVREANVEHTQSPPSILREVYIPIAATRLGFTRKKR